MLEAELDHELGYSKYDYKSKATDNSRNGSRAKTVRSDFGENETSKFWLKVLTDLQQRGVKDVLIVSIDGLNGFKEAMYTLTPRFSAVSSI